MLLGKGANIDCRCEDGEAALIMASGEGHKEVVEKMMGKGASIDVQDKYGATAVMLASQKGLYNAPRTLK